MLDTDGLGWNPTLSATESPGISMDQTDTIVLLFRLVVVLALALWFWRRFRGPASPLRCILPQQMTVHFFGKDEAGGATSHRSGRGISCNVTTSVRGSCGHSENPIAFQNLRASSEIALNHDPPHADGLRSLQRRAWPASRNSERPIPFPCHALSIARRPSSTTGIG